MTMPFILNSKKCCLFRFLHHFLYIYIYIKHIASLSFARFFTLVPTVQKYSELSSYVAIYCNFSNYNSWYPTSR
jgi:hypothetical protein